MVWQNHIGIIIILLLIACVFLWKFSKTKAAAKKTQAFTSEKIEFENKEQTHKKRNSELVEAVQNQKPDDNRKEEIHFTYPTTRYKFPPLSDVDEEIKIRSFRKRNKFYSVNLFNQTCTCDRFTRDKKSTYDKHDYRRLCKHLVRILYEFGDIDLMPPAFKCLLDEMNDCEWGARRADYRIAELKNFEILVGKSEVSEWFYVATKDRKRGIKTKNTHGYRIFPYNRKIGQWRNGYAPTYNVQIERMINSWKE